MTHNNLKTESNQDIVFTQHISKTDISKTFCLTKDNVIDKKPAARYYSGIGETITCPWAEFPDYLTKATTKNALTFGINKYEPSDPYEVTTKAKENKIDGAYARIKDNFTYPQLVDDIHPPHGILMLDHDPDGVGKSFASPAEFIEHLTRVFPDIARTAYIARGSVSAGVHIEGEQPKPSAGFHVYLPVNTASDIPRFGKVFFKRMILGGFGHIVLAKNGRMDIRSAFDSCVFSPERLDFVAPPLLIGAGLDYTAPEITSQKGDFLYTNGLQDLTADERKEYSSIVAELRNEARPESKKVEDAFIQNIRATHEHISEDDLALLRGSETIPRNYKVVTENGELITVQQLIDNGDEVVIADPISGISYGGTTAKFYPNKDGKPFINSFAHHGRKYHIAEIGQKPPGKDALKIAADIEFLIKQWGMCDAEDCKINTDNIQKIIERSFWNPRRSKFYTMTKANTLNEYAIADVLGAVIAEHGALLDKKYLYSFASNAKESKEISSLIKSCEAQLLNYLIRHSQRTSIEMRVDVFATEPRIEMRDERARIVFLHIPYKTSRVRNERAIADYKEHFPLMDDFLDFIIASRFARDRKKSYLWFKCETNWGKGFLMGLLDELNMTVELSVAEVEKMLDGGAAGREMADFKNALVLVFDEFKTIKSEIKQLQSYISLAPKFLLNFKAEIYAKLFFSAEDVPSLVGEHGVEDQFLNRFNHFSMEGNIEHRPLYQELGSAAYMDGLVPYVCDYFNNSIADYVALGKTQAEKKAELFLKEFMQRHGLGNFHNKLSDGINVVVRELAQHIRNTQAFNPNVIKSIHGLFLRNADKFIQDYINDQYSESGKTMIGFKRSLICKKLSLDGKGSQAHRIPGMTPKVTRAILVDPTLYDDSNNDIEDGIAHYANSL